MRTFFLAVALSLGAIPVWAADQAGIVITATGECMAVGTGGEQRVLQRRSPLFIGDQLHTGAQAKLQIRFTDGAIVSIRPDSEFRIDDYALEKSEGTGKSVSTLLKGGFRAITGSIGKTQPENYQIKTPVATIGVRGTNFEAVLAQELYVAAWRGAISLTNKAGELTVGEGAAFNYASIRTFESAPKGLLQAPKPLLQEQSEVESPVVHHSESQPQDEPPITESPAPATEQSASLESLRNDNSLEQESLVNTETINQPVTDLRLSATEQQQLTRLGALTLEGVARDTVAGRSGTGDDGLPLFVDNGRNPGDADFDIAATVSVIRQGNAVALSQQDQYDYRWGHWNSTVDAAAIAQTNPSDPALSTPLIGSIYWFTVAAVEPLVQSIGGIQSYSNVISFEGAGQDGAMSDMLFAAILNFNSGRITGSLRVITTGASVWDVSFDGYVVGTTVNYAALYGLYQNLAPIDAQMPLLFTGDQAQAIGGALQLQSTEDSRQYLQGVFLVDNQTIPEQRLTSAERGKLNRFGMAVYEYNGATVLNSGRAGTNNGVSIITDNGFRVGQPGYTIAPMQSVLRQGTSVLQNAGANTQYEVDWGEWNATAAAPALRQTDPAAPAVADTLEGPVYWMTVKPTNIDSFTPLRGQAVYNNVLMYQGADHNQVAIQSLSMQATVDFTAAKMTGQLNVTAGENWQMQIDAGFQGPAFQATLNGTRNTTETATGTMQGTFAGNRAQALGAVFGVRGVDTPTSYVHGSVLTECSACP